MNTLNIHVYRRSPWKDFCYVWQRSGELSLSADISFNPALQRRFVAPIGFSEENRPDIDH